MNRRESLGVLAALTLFAAAPRALGRTPRRVVVLLYAPLEDATVQFNLRLLREGLGRDGLAEGRDYTIDPVHLHLGPDLEERARAAIQGDPALAVALTTPLAQAAARATRTVPVVFGIVSDPVGSGIVASLARPGGNVTGVSNMLPELSGKLLELLLELIPGATRAAVLWNPDNPAKRLELLELRIAAKRRAVDLVELPVRSRAEIEAALQTAARMRVHALVVLAETLTQANRKRLAELASASRLPVLANNHSPTEEGGLASYSPDYAEMGRRTGALAAKILRGTRAAEIPVERPTVFGLTINRAAARALGIAVPEAVLLRADRVIE